jgi:hypothetical protein
MSTRSEIRGGGGLADEGGRGSAGTLAAGDPAGAGGGLGAGYDCRARARPPPAHQDDAGELCPRAGGPERGLGHCRPGRHGRT